MLALSQTPHIHWAMVLTLDLLGLACCGGAAGVSHEIHPSNDAWLTVPQVLTYALANETDLFYSLDASTSPTLTLPPLVLVYFCMAILSILAARSFMFWVRTLRRSPPEVQAKEAYEEQSWTPPVEQGHIPPRQYQALPSNQPRFSQDRHSDFKSSASTRPLSTVESLAYWSDVSGGATLTQAPSIRSSDTKSPPSYASPVTSRAPTTIHRRPLA